MPLSLKQSLDVLQKLKIYPSKKQVVKLLWNIFTNYHDEIEKMGFDKFLNHILKPDYGIEPLKAKP